MFLALDKIIILLIISKSKKFATEMYNNNRNLDNYTSKIKIMMPRWPSNLTVLSWFTFEKRTAKKGGKGEDNKKNTGTTTRGGFHSNRYNQYSK